MTCAPVTSTSRRFGGSRSPTPGCLTGGGRALVFRTTHPRSPRRGPTRVGVADLRPAHHPTNPGQLVHQGHHQRGRSADQLLLQGQPDQAILQGAAGVAYRNGHLQYPRSSAMPAISVSAGGSPPNWKALRAVGDAANQRLASVWGWMSTTRPTPSRMRSRARRARRPHRAAAPRRSARTGRGDPDRSRHRPR